VIAVFDLTNSFLSVGFFERGEWLCRQTIGRSEGRSADEYVLLIRLMLDQGGLGSAEWEGAILSSSVPSETERVEAACLALTGRKPLRLGPGVKSGIKLRMDAPGELGSDLVAQAVSAHARVEGNLVILDEDDITTLSAVTAAGEFRGGLVLPGPQLSLRALRGRAAQLQEISLRPTSLFIGKNNGEAISSGIMNGYAASLRFLVAGMRAELGGEASLVRSGRSPLPPDIEGLSAALYDQWLCLDGLVRIFEANK
jgi:type III pantothenate kinase